MTPLKRESERRRWTRLPLAIPVFVRSRDQEGKEFLEFATAWNVSAGGAMIAVRRSLRLSSQVLLEIPSAPAATSPESSKASSRVQAKAKWVTHAEGYHLIGLKFAHPLLDHASPRTSVKRKVASSQ
ncbi:MAG TPA: PilZ domain-containing protein [Terriglobales bacterium]|nr:PilZ domain-containing protein [Terriglobales bacterium]